LAPECRGQNAVLQHSRCEQCPSGADALDRYLHATAGPKIVLGHSEGAQVEDDWLRRYGPTSDIDLATVTFVLTGDLESKYGGCANASNSGCTAADGARGFPIDTRYTSK
jgi:3'-(hydroxy)phthioceranyl-2'-palmitoyl(stearoyl)-2-O-sulfo-trehalose (hydroxy)phthioceranyltransferase